MTTLFTLIAVFLGCNISRTSLMKNDKIMVEKIDSNCFTVQKGNISKEDGSIIVFGKVERKRMSMAASGHVDIEVLNESVK